MSALILIIGTTFINTNLITSMDVYRKDNDKCIIHLSGQDHPNTVNMRCEDIINFINDNKQTN